MSSNDADKALLSFSLGPVQPFIEAARTVRDLWSGSYLLAWLTVAAMKPIRDACGDAAVISPSLAGNPLLAAFDHPTRDEKATTPCLPNRFVAEVPAGKIEDLSKACVDAAQAEWTRIADQVRSEIGKQFRHGADDWDRLWDAQIGSFFEFRVAAVKLADCEANSLKELGVTVGKDGWLPLEYLGQLAEAQRSVRHVPRYTATPDDLGRYPAKCSLLGTYEHVGPADLQATARYWLSKVERGQIRRTERLCAVSLVKRFAWKHALAERVGVSVDELRFSDTATIAATEWLREEPVLRLPRGGSGQWLHWSSPDEEDDERTCDPETWSRIRAKARDQGPPPTYYAVLMLDGDGLGKLLRGDSGGESWGTGRNRPRAISQRLTRFALDHVERIVEQEHHGELIYAGGDDVLALLPTRTALSCAKALADRYMAADVMDGATVSAGIAVVHYKEDLRFALGAARTAEKAAKSAGRNALALTICRRGGEHTTAVMGWEQLPAVQSLIEHFIHGVSDRWTYHLRRELPTLAGALAATPPLPWRQLLPK